MTAVTAATAAALATTPTAARLHPSGRPTTPAYCRRGPQAARPAARPRRADPLLGRLRRDRVLDLLRARDHRAACPRAHAGRPARRRRALLPRLALVCGGHRRDPGDGR